MARMLSSRRRSSDVERRRRIQHLASTFKDPFVAKEVRDKKFYREVTRLIENELQHLKIKNILKLVDVLFIFFGVIALFIWEWKELIGTWLIWMPWQRWSNKYKRVLRRKNVLWRNAEKVFNDLDPDERFTLYLDVFPEELKDTKCYKDIRRLHWELSCYMGNKLLFPDKNVSRVKLVNSENYFPDVV